MSKTTVRIDSNVCQGHGTCASLAPAIFVLNADGYGEPVSEVIPDELAGEARDAAQGCPEWAIAVDAE